MQYSYKPILIDVYKAFIIRHSFSNLRIFQVSFILSKYSRITVQHHMIRLDALSILLHTTEKKTEFSLFYIPSYVHVRPGFREKSANLQGTLKPHLRFYNRFLRLQTNENWHAHYSLCACSMATNASISQG